MKINQRILSRFTVILPPYFWLLIFYLFPILVVFSISFTIATPDIPPYTKLIEKTLEGKNKLRIYFDNYNLLTGDSLYISAYLNSLFIALLSTLITLSIAYPVAYSISLLPRKIQKLVLFLILLPNLTPLLIRAYSWMIVLSPNGAFNQFLISLGIISEPLLILNTKGAIILGIIYAYFPFVVLPLYNSISKIDKSLIEAAEDLGCTSFKVFYKIIVPLSLPGAISGAMLIFIPSIGEFVIPDLLGGTNVIMIGKVLWNEFFLNRDWPLAAALTIITFIILVVPVVIFQRLTVRKGTI